MNPLWKAQIEKAALTSLTLLRQYQVILLASLDQTLENIATSARWRNKE